MVYTNYNTYNPRESTLRPKFVAQFKYPKPSVQLSYDPAFIGRKFYHSEAVSVNWPPAPPEIPNERSPVGFAASRPSSGMWFASECSTPRQAKCNPPPFPHEAGGSGSLGMGFGTPLPVAIQVTRWKRRMRNLPTATRGTDARPMTSSARKRSFAHISCVGLRHPSERRDSTPVSKTCHRA